MLRAIVHVALLIAAFILGYYANAWIYKDICLDLGGAMQTDHYPICVIEQRPTNDKLAP